MVKLKRIPYCVRTQDKITEFYSPDWALVSARSYRDRFMDVEVSYDDHVLYVYASLKPIELREEN